MIANVKLHHTATNFRQLIALGRDGHTRFNGCGTRGGITSSSLNLDQTNPAGSKGFQRIGSTELRHLDPGLKGGPHNGGARRNGNVPSVNG